MTGTAPTTVLYRGPLERSRLGFLIQAAKRAYGEVKLVWLVPPQVSLANAARHPGLQKFLAGEGVREVEFLDGRMTRVAAAIRDARRIVNRSAPLVSVGFSSLPYGRALSAGPLVWCVNGVPEERLLHRSGQRDRVAVRALWASTRLGRTPTLTVTVSEPMSELVRGEMGDLATEAVPNCVDRSRFDVRGDLHRRYLAYLGTGAPWQGLEQLGKVWGLLSRLDAGLVFRVISTDDRARLLGDDVPASSIEFRAAEGPAEVASLLHECRAGFLIRRPHIANRVSFPTKFGEYVASGVPVLCSDVGWALTDMVKATGCGALVPPGEGVAEVARRVSAFLDDQATDATAAACSEAARLLDRATWVERLAARLPRS